MYRETEVSRLSTNARSWSFALHFQRSYHELMLTRHNENQMYRETPVSRTIDTAAKLQFRGTSDFH